MIKLEITISGPETGIVSENFIVTSKGQFSNKAKEVQAEFALLIKEHIEERFDTELMG